MANDRYGNKGIFIVRSRNTDIASSTKNGKARTIELPPIAVEYLKQEQVKQIEN